MRLSRRSAALRRELAKANCAVQGYAGIERLSCARNKPQGPIAEIKSNQGPDIGQIAARWHNRFMAGSNVGQPRQDRPSPEFMRLVRDALAHLYDPAHLAQHPLVTLLLPPTQSPGQALRNLLIDAIEALDPYVHGRAGERERRPYLVLVHRYVDGFAPEEVAARLHISPRQFQRELHKGLEALVADLWRRRQEIALAQSSDLQGELEALGLHLEPVRLEELVGGALPALEPVAAMHGVTLRVRPSASTTLCLADRTLARQALVSCVGALVLRHPTQLELCMTHNGQAALLQLAPFPRLPAADWAALESSLSTGRALMVAQGGALQLLRGEGSALVAVQLIFRLGCRPHVLVIDDNEQMLQLYERYLSAGQFASSFARSAREAEACLEQSVPDLIVLDVMMRGVDGWELLRELRSKPALARIPIIVCSVLREPEIAQALGAQAYIAKPVTPELLLATINRLLRQQQAQV